MKAKECKKCGILEYENVLNNNNGICWGCYSDMKVDEQYYQEKKQRREESGYFQQTGKYNKKGKLSSKWRW